MYEKRGDRYHFLLTDFDMATTLVPQDHSADPKLIPSCKDRTGTLPFMAREIIESALWERDHEGQESPTKQCLRHDLESLLYVCVYALCMYAHNGLTDREASDLKDAMNDWENTDKLASVLGIKEKLCSSGPTYKFSPAAAPLNSWFMGWRKIFVDVTVASLRHDIEAASGKLAAPLDKETFGGTFTGATLKAALAPGIPVDDKGRLLPAFAATLDEGPEEVEHRDLDGDVAADSRAQDMGDQKGAEAIEEAVATPARSETVVATVDEDQAHTANKAGPSTPSGAANQPLAPDIRPRARTRARRQAPAAQHSETFKRRDPRLRPRKNVKYT